MIVSLTALFVSLRNALLRDETKTAAWVIEPFDIVTLKGNFDRIFNSNKKHVRASIDDIFISLVKLDNLPPYKIYEDFCPLTEKKKTKTKKKNKKKTGRPSIWIALCVRVAITYCIISDVDCKNKADVSTYKFQRY